MGLGAGGPGLGLPPPIEALIELILATDAPHGGPAELFTDDQARQLVSTAQSHRVV